MDHHTPQSKVGIQSHGSAPDGKKDRAARMRASIMRHPALGVSALVVAGKYAPQVTPNERTMNEMLEVLEGVPSDVFWSMPAHIHEKHDRLGLIALAASVDTHLPKAPWLTSSTVSAHECLLATMALVSEFGGPRSCPLWHEMMVPDINKDVSLSKVLSAWSSLAAGCSSTTAHHLAPLERALKRQNGMGEAIENLCVKNHGPRDAVEHVMGLICESDLTDLTASAWLKLGVRCMLLHEESPAALSLWKERTPQDNKHSVLCSTMIQAMIESVRTPRWTSVAQATLELARQTDRPIDMATHILECSPIVPLPNLAPLMISLGQPDALGPQAVIRALLRSPVAAVVANEIVCDIAVKCALKDVNMIGKEVWEFWCLGSLKKGLPHSASVDSIIAYAPMLSALFDILPSSTKKDWLTNPLLTNHLPNVQAAALETAVAVRRPGPPRVM